MYSLQEAIRRYRNRDKEDGFTLLELIIVFAVIGILTLIAVPAFQNQREAAAVSSVKSDLRNSGMNMEQSLLSNSNRYPSYIPNYTQKSPGTKIDLDLTTSNEQKFCIIGTHKEYPTIKFSYDSSMGGLLPRTQNCIVPSSGNWQLEMQDKKVLIVYAYNDVYKNFMIQELKDAGFGTVEYRYNAPVTDYDDYDLIVGLGAAWAVPYAVMTNLETGYRLGHSVLIEGNDNSSNNMPFMFEQSRASGAVGDLYLNKTRNQVTPAFPYTFDAVAFANDSGWYCVTKVVPAAVVTTNTPLTGTPGVDCATSAVMAGSNGGRMGYVIFLPTNYDNQSFINSMTQWLITK